MPPLNTWSKTGIAVAVVNALATSCANAATITVGNTGDGAVVGPCTLRDAITTHNTSTNTGNCIAVGAFGDNQIEFNLPNPSTITLVSSPLEITEGALEIIGPGQDAVSIDASNVARAINIDSLSSVNLEGLTFDGGGISITNSNIISLRNSTISNSTTTGYGGGLFINGSDNITIQSCQITNNAAYAGGGIAILNSYGVKVRSSTITGNVTTGNGAEIGGGGIDFRRLGDALRSSEDRLYIFNSTIANNTTSNDGGGINAITDRSTTFVNIDILSSVISNNMAGSDGGGLRLSSYRLSNYFGSVGSRLNIVETTVSGNTAVNKGGGIYQYRPRLESIRQSTISKNSAARGGGIFTVFGDWTLSNSTLSANSASLSGSAIAIVASDRATVNQTTIVDHVGSAAISGFTTTNIQANNVLSNNEFGNCSDETPQVGTFNWLDDTSCGTPNLGDPDLGELTDNGGLTETHAPISGSGLIGAGLVSACNSAPINGIDQRGEPRGTTSCFIGSVEGVVDPPEPSSFFVIPLPDGKAVVVEL